MRFIYLFIFLFSFAQAQTVQWEVSPTGENMSVLINLSTTPNIGTNPMTTSDTIGVFYQDGTVLKCGGKTAWNGNPSQAISFPAYQDDSGTPATDGFSANDNFIWRVKSGGTTYNANVTYVTSGPFDSIFVVDGFAQISALNVVFSQVLGCTDSNYLEYNPAANTDDGSCATLKVFGCMDTNYLEFNPAANVDNGSCATLKVFGCTDTNYLEYNPAANVDNGSCATLKVFGCMDDDYLEYNASANVDDGSCVTLKVLGCMDSNYVEYNPSANVDDGSCATLKVYGCTDTNYFEFDPLANTDDGSCDSLKVYGCMDPLATNYNANANLDNGSCDYSCPTPKVPVIVKVFPKKGENQNFYVTEDGVTVLTKANSEINDKDSVIYNLCFDANQNIHFQSTNLDSFAIINCGLLVTPSSPNTASFLTWCNPNSVNETEFPINFYQEGNRIYFETNKVWTIEIFNVLGQNVLSQKLNSSDYIDLKNHDGIFVLKVNDGNQSWSKKIIVK
jgi:hypothetical protein